MVVGGLKAQAASGVLRTNWSSRSSFPSSGRLFWPLYARSWHVAWVGGSRVAVHARAGIDFVRLRLPPCSSVPHQRPLPCPLCPYCPLCPWGRPRRAGRRLAPPGGGIPVPPAPPRSRAPAEVRLGDGEKARLRMVGRGRFSPRGGRCATEGGRDLGKRRVLAGGGSPMRLPRSRGAAPEKVVAELSRTCPAGFCGWQVAYGSTHESTRRI